MKRKITLLLVALLCTSPYLFAQTYTPVNVTGLNADIIAEGSQSPAATINSSAAGLTIPNPGFCIGYSYVSKDYTFSVNAASAGIGLPVSGLITDAANANVSFQLAPYTGNNVLQLSSAGAAGTGHVVAPGPVTSGTLTFTTPRACTNIFLLDCSASGTTIFTATVNFTDGTNQVFSGLSSGDWGGANGTVVTSGMGRIGSAPGYAYGTGFYLFHHQLAISAGNTSKIVQSVTIQDNETASEDNTLGVFAIAANPPPCVAPAAQPTTVVLNVSPGTIIGTITPPTPVPDGYLVVRTNGTTTVGATPSNSLTYILGSSFGNGTIVSVGNSTTFTDAGVAPSTLYTYTIFAYNYLCTGGPLYNSTNPLIKSVTSAYSGVVPITVSGYTDDMIANGAGTAANSVSPNGGLDPNNHHYYASADYSFNGFTAGTVGLPLSGVINSLITPGLTFQLANYSVNNCLFLPSVASTAPHSTGTFTFSSPITSSTLYVLVSMSNSNSPIVAATVNFVDGSTQSFPTFASGIPDWTIGNAAVNAINGLTLVTNTNDHSVTGCHMEQYSINLSTANATKPIASVTFTHDNSAGGEIAIWAISGLTPCTAPTAQPTNLTFTTTAGVINGSFLPTSTASYYITVRTPGNTPFTNAAAFVNGTAYPVGTSIPNGSGPNAVVVGSGAGTTFTDVGLASQTLYTYTVFAVNNNVCSGGPVFNTVNPLVNSFTSAFNGFTAVPVTGFNYDMVANGAANPATTVSAGGGFDLTGNTYYTSADYSYNGQTAGVGTNATTGLGLPLSGLAASVTTPGLSFQFASYSGNNCLWLPSVTGTTPHSTGTLSLVNPVATNTLYVLASSGGGAGAISVVVTFIDGTTQSFASFSIPDWSGSGGTANAIANLLAVNKTTFAPYTGHYIEQYALTISPANATKPIASVTFTNSSTSGNPGIWALSIVTPCPALTTQATNLTLVSTQNSVTGSFTASVPAASGYLVVRTPANIALNTPPVNFTTYAANSQLGNGTIVAVGAGTAISDLTLSAGTAYTYTVFDYTTATTCAGPIYNTISPLTKTVTTAPATIYTWNQAVSGNYTVAANWTPTRTTPNITDVLVFNNGFDTVTSVPTQQIARISVNNNSTVHLQSAANTTLTINSDGVPSTNELDIASGSTLILDGTTAQLALAFSNNAFYNLNNTPINANVNVAGTLEVASTASVANILNLAGSVDTIRVGGVLAAGGSNSSTLSIVGTVQTIPAGTPPITTLTVFGTYNHKYTVTGGAGIPTATWVTGSVVSFSSFTTATSNPLTGMNQPFYSMVYNCPNQTVNMNWGTSGPLTVSGTFTMVSSGTGALQFAGNTAYAHTFNNYTQTGGILDLSSVSSALTQVLNVSGTFNQTNGSFQASNTNVAPSVTLNFNGPGTAVQQVNFSTAPTGPLTYRFSNPLTVNMTSTPPLSASLVLPVNSGGGVRVSVAATNPLTSNVGAPGTTGGLALTYTSGTTLTYDTLSNVTATAAIWPSVASPYNVTVNVGAGNAVTIPFAATVGGTLTFLSGDLNITTNTLTIGTSATSAGAIVPSSSFTAPGNIRITSGGLKRWFNPSLVPIAPTATGSLGYFPVSVGLSQRYVYIYFNNTAAINAGGTITVTHNGATTTGVQTLGTPVNDATSTPAFSITTQTKASWTLSNSSMTLNAGSTMGVRITGADMFNPLNVPNLRLMHVSTVAGTYVPGSGIYPNVSAERTGLGISDLSSAFYIGGDGNSIQAIWTAITTGNWNDGTKWDQGSAPGSSNIAVINPGVVTSINTTTCAARSLTINGTITGTAGNTLTLDSAMLNNGSVSMPAGSLLVSTVPAKNVSTNGIINNGQFVVSGGTVQSGATNGANKQFINNGTLSVSSGSLMINGNLNIQPNSVFVQKGGSISVDGNAGNVLANSVGQGTTLVNLGSSSMALTGGTLTIVDPHADNTSTTATPSFNYTGPLPFSDSPGHTIAFGDGISSDTGGNASGFVVSVAGGFGRFNFGSLVINGHSGTNRWVTPTNPAFGVYGNMTINNGGEYRTSGISIYLNGNLTVNTGGILTADFPIQFSNYVLASSGTATPTPSLNTQSFTSTGLLRNAAVVSPTANITGLTIMNNAAVKPGLSINTSGTLSYSGTLNFIPTNNIPTLLYVAPGFSMAEAGTGAPTNYGATSGWVVGAYQKHALVGGLSLLYPIGDAANFTPVLITGPSTAVSAAGDISAKVTPNLHPQFATSGLNPLAAVKRYVTLDTLNGIRFGNQINGTNQVSVLLSWVPTDVIGTLTSVHAGFDTTINSAGGWLRPFLAVGSASSTSVQVTGLGKQDGTRLTGDYQPADTCPTTIITAQPQNTSACIGGAAPFSVTATGAGLTYAWYQAGTPASVGNQAVLNVTGITASNGGSYFVVISSACAKPDTSASALLSVGGAPVITLQPLSQTICAGPDTIEFIVDDNSLGGQFTWFHNYSASPVTAGPHPGAGTVYINGSPSTGFRSDTLMIVNPTINDSGVYICNISIGCVAAATYPATLTINNQPVASIISTGPTSFCTGGNVTLNATPGAGYSYQWNNTGNPIPGSTGTSYVATASGVYNLDVVDANGCIASSGDIIVNANSLPAPNIAAAGNTTFCAGGSVTILTTPTPGYIYEWLLDANHVAGPALNYTSYQAFSGGSYQVQVSTPSGCVGVSAPLQITEVAAPSVVVSSSGPTSICAGTSVSLSSTVGTGYTYQWQDANGNITGQNGITFSAGSAGVYDVVVSNGACTTTSSQVTVSVNANPTAQITAVGGTTLCQGSILVLDATAGSGLSYQWYNNGINIAGATDVSYSAGAGGSYTVQVTDNNNCSATSTALSLSVNPLPIPVISRNGSVLSTPSVYITYQWYLDSHPISGATSASYTALQDGTYSVLVSDANGCSNMSSVADMSHVGVGTVSKGDIKIYPNPAQSVVHIEAPYSVDVSVSGLDGKTVLEQRNATQIDISHLANGVYMIRVTNESGALISIEKLIKTDL